MFITAQLPFFPSIKIIKNLDIDDENEIFSLIQKSHN